MTAPRATVIRADLPAEPLAAYQRVDDLLDELAASRRALIALRDRVLAQEIVGPDRGGRSRASEALGVSTVQIHRLLADGVMRAVRTAMDTAHIPAADYVATPAKGGRVAVHWLAPMVEEIHEVTCLNAAGYLLDMWRLEAGLPVEAEDGGNVRDALAAGHVVFVGPAAG